MRDRAIRAGRRASFRDPRLRILVVCSGERTEPDYFLGLKRHLRNPAVQVKLKAKGRAPVDLVRYARSIAPKGADEFDELWCVVDSDEYDLEPAVALATELGVQLAVSNPCFELWLLLHHQDCAAPFCDAKAVMCQLIRRVPGYQKNALRFATSRQVCWTRCDERRSSTRPGVTTNVIHRVGSGGWYVR
jgi:hypothetical protein